MSIAVGLDEGEDHAARGPDDTTIAFLDLGVARLPRPLDGDRPALGRRRDGGLQPVVVVEPAAQLLCPARRDQAELPRPRDELVVWRRGQLHEEGVLAGLLLGRELGGGLGRSGRRRGVGGSRVRRFFRLRGAGLGRGRRGRGGLGRRALGEGALYRRGAEG